jgi:hypothetical protein
MRYGIRRMNRTGEPTVYHADTQLVSSGPAAESLAERSSVTADVLPCCLPAGYLLSLAERGDSTVHLHQNGGEWQQGSSFKGSTLLRASRAGPGVR